MARPPNANTEETHDKILESALELLGERSPKDFSMREVAQRAEVAVSLVNHYFGNKEGLLTACLDTMYAELEEAWARAVSRLGSYEQPLDFVEPMMREAFDFAVTHEPTTRAALAMVATSGELPERAETRMRRPFLSSWSSMIALRLACDEQQVRLSLQSLVFLSGRYGVASRNELATILGAPKEADLDTLREAVADHLVLVARAMLGALDQSSTPTR